MILSTIVVVDSDGNEHPYHADLLLERDGSRPVSDPPIALAA